MTLFSYVAEVKLFTSQHKGTNTKARAAKNQLLVSLIGYISGADSGEVDCRSSNDTSVQVQFRGGNHTLCR